MSLFLLLSLQHTAWPLHKVSWSFVGAPMTAPGAGMTIQVGIWKGERQIRGKKGRGGQKSSTRGFWDRKIKGLKASLNASQGKSALPFLPRRLWLWVKM